jgi:hypothetical protein
LKPEPFGSFPSVEEFFPYKDKLYFVYDAFGDHIGDSPNTASPWHQYYRDSTKDGTQLQVDDPVFREWWTMYTGFDNCCGKCPGCFAIEYQSDTESPKDPLPGSFSWFTFSLIYIIRDYIAMLLGQ